MRSLADVIKQLSINPETGLSDATVTQSMQQFGGNSLTPLPREPLWKKFLEKFDEPIIKILLAAALLSMFVDLFQGNPTAAGIALVVVAAAVISVFVLGKAQLLPSLMFISAL